MARKTTSSQLQGAAPSLQPVARPLSIPIGATPPSRKGSQLMELADAFTGFNGELRGLLRDAAARSDRDAMALGEIEAQKDIAAGNLKNLEGALKSKVDAGELPAHRSPVFERTYRATVGAYYGDVFAAKLTERLGDVAKAGLGPDDYQARAQQVIAEAYAEVSKDLDPGDLYGQSGFTRTAQAASSAFLQRAATQYAENYKEAGEGRLADSGAELLLQLSQSPAEDASRMRDAVKAHMDEVRSVLPVHEANAFYAQRIVAPTVERLIGENKLTEARHLLEDVEGIDLTGKGAFFGNTADALRILDPVRARLNQAERSTTGEWERLNEQDKLHNRTGSLAAGQDLLQLRLDNGGQLPPEQRYKLIDAYRAAHPDDPLAVQAYTQAVHSDYENEERFRTNARAESDFEVSVKSLSKTDIDAKRAELEAKWQTKEVSAAFRTRMSQQLDKLDALYGMVDEGDFRAFTKDLYATRDALGGVTINFGDAESAAPDSSLNLWQKLSPTLREEHEQRTLAFFKSTLEDSLRKLEDPAKVGAEKFRILNEATTKAREFARTELRSLSGVDKQRKQQAEVASQAQAIKRSFRDYSYEKTVTTTEADAPPGVAPETHTEVQTVVKGYKLPREYEARLRLNEELKKAPTERDVAIVRLPGDYSRSDLFLPDIAKDALENPVPAARAKALEIYFYGKSALGYTEAEIRARKTKHGIPIDPTQIDPHYMRVFGSVAELNKHWNNGEPDETFMFLGDSVDPHDKLTPREFYKAQRALLDH